MFQCESLHDEATASAHKHTQILCYVSRCVYLDSSADWQSTDNTQPATSKHNIYTGTHNGLIKDFTWHD